MYKFYLNKTSFPRKRNLRGKWAVMIIHTGFDKWWSARSNATFRPHTCLTPRQKPGGPTDLLRPNQTGNANAHFTPSCKWRAKLAQTEIGYVLVCLPSCIGETYSCIAQRIPVTKRKRQTNHQRACHHLLHVQTTTVIEYTHHSPTNELHVTSIAEQRYRFE